LANKGQQFKHYDLDFKIKLVTLYLKGQGGLRTLAREYGLEHTQIRDWVKKYKAGELTESKADMRGKVQFRKTIFSNNEEKLEYLQLENEYLKKNCLQRARWMPPLQVYGHQRI
jgi:transposase